ncbi:SMR family transporter [Lederbergia sp. NSJ-179]|uniref:DMT family transporter n=1 Tax=Lederbergia sp. NSJ-179 TaxID=2931402 RepID=UPI001FD23C4F|nr:SMR family transporter [Lederbergia sp. NSJ-179]MCJ7840115.1 SMR family transporter [Lederbergia sp. NSJ-179]
MNKAWVYVTLTCFFELIWIYGFNTAHQWWHWFFILLFIFTDFHFLTKACELLPTGSVYATFAGVGTVGTALMDIFFFGQTFSVAKILFIMILVAGVIGLNLADREEEKGTV